MLISTTIRKRAADGICRFVWEQMTGRKYRRIHTEPTYLHLTPGKELSTRLRNGEMTVEDWKRLNHNKPGRLHQFNQGWLKKLIEIPYGFEIAWEGAGVNALVDAGEEYLLKTFFNAAAAPSNLYFALSTQNEATMGETVTSGTGSGTPFTEVTGTGYSRVSLTTNDTDFVPSLVGGDWQVLTPSKTFNATGNWDPALALVLADHASVSAAHKVVATSNLSTSRTLVNGDSLTVTMKVTAQ